MFSIGNPLQSFLSDFRWNWKSSTLQPLCRRQVIKVIQWPLDPRTRSTIVRRPPAEHHSQAELRVAQNPCPSRIMTQRKNSISQCGPRLPPFRHLQVLAPILASERFRTRRVNNRLWRSRLQANPSDFLEKINIAPIDPFRADTGWMRPDNSDDDIIAETTLGQAPDNEKNVPGAISRRTPNRQCEPSICPASA